MSKYLICYPKLEHKMCREAFDNYRKEYNEDKDLREQLRDTHYTLFCTILTLYSRQLYKRNQKLREDALLLTLDPSCPPSLRTNNYNLSERIQGVSKKTIYNRMKRLIDAGIISDKMYHGTKHDYELLINADFLLISDVNNAKYQPVSPYLTNTENQQNIKVQKKNLPQSTINLQEHSNNIIINSGKIENDFNLLKNENINENTEEYSKTNFKNTNDKQNTETTPQLTPAEKKQKDLENYRNMMAKWVYAYLVHFLMPDKTIFHSVKIQSINYIQKFYLNKLHSKKSIEQQCDYLKFVIDHIKKKYIDNGYTIENYPMKYLDVHNTKSGFVNVYNWLIDSITIKKQLEANKLERDKLNKIIRYYQNAPTLARFVQCEAYVKDNIPEFMDEFLMFYNSGSREIFNHFKQKSA